MCGEEAEVSHCAHDTAIVDEITDLEGAENQQHDAGSDIGQCSLQGETDGQACSAYNSEETCRLNPELLKRREYREDDNRVANHASEEPLKHRVDFI